MDKKIFRFSFSENNEDCFDIDVNQIYKNNPINKKIKPKPNQVKFNRSIFHRIYRNRLLPLKVRIFFWYLFRRTNLDLTWFKIFSEYGNRILYHGRRFFFPPDLFFYKNYFNARFGNNRFPITNDPYVHLDAHQILEILFHLFYLVSKEGYSFNYDYLKILKKK